MDILVVILVVITLIGICLVFFTLRRKEGTDPSAQKELHEKMVRLEERIGQLNEKSSEQTRVLDQKLGESTRAIQQQFGQSAKIIQDVT